jgi:O-antigen ligase
MTWLAPLGDLGPQRLINDMGSSGRIELWTQALAAIAERPWFGWGEGMFPILSGVGFTHPHNVVLQVLLAWGIVGALLVAVLMGWLARRIHRSVDERGAPFLFAALMLAAASLVDGVLYLNQSTALFAMCIAVLAAKEAQQAAVPAASAGLAHPSALAGALS